MDDDKVTSFFLVNMDRKEMVDCKKVGIDHFELKNKLIQKEGFWSEENVQLLNELNMDHHTFMDISDDIIKRRESRSLEPYIIVDFPDEKTEAVTLHRIKLKKDRIKITFEDF